MKLYKYILILVALTSAHMASAQQNVYPWRVGGSFGFMGYYGDLSYEYIDLYNIRYGYGLSLERALSPTLSVSLGANMGKIAGNDRARNYHGELLYDNNNFERALNFETEIRSLNLNLIFNTDNGWLLSKNAFFSPYVFVGAGITDFDVYGDLFDGNGQWYYYWSDNTIRTLPQNPGNAPQAEIVGQDEIYETRLTGLNTEKDEPYETTAFHLTGGLGLKFRLSDRVNINLQSAINYVFSDYLDDVSGNYRDEYSNGLQAYAANPSNIVAESRGNENNRNDKYAFTSVSLFYNFGRAKSNFKAPVYYYNPGIYRNTPLTTQKYDEGDMADIPDDEDERAENPDTQLLKNLLNEIALLRLENENLKLQKRGEEMGRQIDSLRNLVAQQGELDTAALPPAPAGEEISKVRREAMAGPDSVTRSDTAALNQQNERPAAENLVQVEGDSLDSKMDSAVLREQKPVINEIPEAQADTLSNNDPPDTLSGGNMSPLPSPEMDSLSSSVVGDALSLDEPETPVIETDSSAIALQEAQRQIKILEAQLQERTETAGPPHPANEGETREDNIPDSIAIKERAALQQSIDSLQRQMEGMQQATENTRQAAEETAAQNPQDETVAALEREIRQLRSRNVSIRNNAAYETERRDNSARISSLEREIDRLRSSNRRNNTVIVPAVAGNGDNNDGGRISQMENELEELQENINDSSAGERNALPQARQTIDSLQNEITRLRDSQDTLARGQNQANDERLNALQLQISRLLAALEERDAAPEPASKTYSGTLDDLSIPFAVNTFEPSADDREKLDSVAEKLAQYPDLKIHLKGFSDKSGNSRYNLELSEKRANSVKDYLMQDTSIEPEQIIVSYYGDTYSRFAEVKNEVQRRVDVEWLQ